MSDTYLTMHNGSFVFSHGERTERKAQQEFWHSTGRYSRRIPNRRTIHTLSKPVVQNASRSFLEPGCVRLRSSEQKRSGRSLDKQTEHTETRQDVYTYSLYVHGEGRLRGREVTRHI